MVKSYFLHILLPLLDDKEFRALRSATKGLAFGNHELLCSPSLIASKSLQANNLQAFTYPISRRYMAKLTQTWIYATLHLLQLNFYRVDKVLLCESSIAGKIRIHAGSVYVLFTALQSHFSMGRIL